MERNVPDMVVSAYYDDCNLNGYEKEFSAYYWNIGRYVADEATRYRATWRDAGERFCMVSYEALHTDFERELRRIAMTLGSRLHDAALSELRDKTSISSLRQRYQDEDLYRGKRFSRKGIVRDWRNHFDTAMVRDIGRIEVSGIGRFDHRLIARKLGRLLHRLGPKHA